MPKLDAEIDKLFQLPPDQFTAARNALAKGAGGQAASIKALTRPPIAAWAVNQLYWQDRETYERVVQASLDMRKAHRAVIEGRKADLRTTGREHELAIDAALKSTLALMADAGQPVTDTTRHAILNTLRALPGTEPPGRLTETLSPGGFELLAGVTPAAPVGRQAASRASRPSTVPKGSKGKDAKAEKEAARERERRAAAERAIRAADQRARQAEFEAARAAREATRAERALEGARQELAAAQEAFDAAEREAASAARARDAADRKLRDAQSALDAAKAGT